MDQLTIYFDRCFGKRLPEAINRARPPFRVEWQHSSKNRFPQNMKDDEWLEICGKKKWVVLSHDRKFHSVAVEAEAIKQHNVAAFALCGADATTWQKLIYFVRAYPKLYDLVLNETPPYMFRIHPTLRFEKIKL